MNGPYGRATGIEFVGCGDARAEVTRAARIGILTCSFRGDLQLCRMLCNSVDRLVPDDITHLVVVPGKDVELFRSMTNHRRQVVAQERWLPPGFWRVPVPTKVWRSVGLPMRDIYLSPRTPPVRGWIVQQIIKLAASRDLDCEVILHADSDIVFIRRLRPERLITDGKVRLYHNPEAGETMPHATWHLAAAKLLGIKPSRYFGADYIDALPTWRRSVVVRLTSDLEARFGTDWRITLARTPHFAEYILYGIFVEHVLGLEQAGHVADVESLALTRWQGDFEDEPAMDAFVRSLRPGHVACGLQSTLGLSIDSRRELVGRLVEHARAQDAVLAGGEGRSVAASTL